MSKLLDLPTELLLAILCFCELKDVLFFERTSQASRELVKSRPLWLALLQSLDQAQAPNLPPHIRVDDLPCSSIRAIVIQAVRAYENVKSGRLEEKTRDVRVELYDIPADEGLLASGGPDLSPLSNKNSVTLLPGGRFLLVQWSHGFIQLVNIERQKAVWTYPEPVPAEERPDGFALVANYSIDIKEDGLVTLALHLRGLREIWLSRLKVLQIDTRSPTGCAQVEKINTFDFNTLTGKKVYVLSASIQGDYIALKCDSPVPSTITLVLVNFVTKKVVFSDESQTWIHFRPEVTIIREHLFYVCASQFGEGESSFLIRVADLHHIFERSASGDGGEQVGKASYPTRTLDFEDLGFSDYAFKIPEGYGASSTTLPSLCTYRWKAPSERFDQVTVMSTVAKGGGAEDLPRFVVNKYAFLSASKSGSSLSPPSSSSCSSPSTSPRSEGKKAKLVLISSEGPTNVVIRGTDGEEKYVSCRGEGLTITGACILYYAKSWKSRAAADGRAIASLYAEKQNEIKGEHVEENGKDKEDNRSLQFSADNVVQWKYRDSMDALGFGWEREDANQGTPVERYTQSTLDYWSGAVVVKRGGGERWIEIKYLA